MLRWEPERLVDELSGLVEHQHKCLSCQGKPTAEWPRACQEHVQDALRRALPLLGATSLQLFELRAELSGQARDGLR